MNGPNGGRGKRPPFSWSILLAALLATVGGTVLAETWHGPFPTTPQTPVRAVAVADVEDLGSGRFLVREYLDVYNDDYRLPLEVRKVTADTWVGHRRDARDESWLEGEIPVVIPPAQVWRVAERQRRTVGRPRRNWWVRWIRFRITTDRGIFASNIVSSPLRPPGLVEEIKPQPKIDALSAPGL